MEGKAENRVIQSKMKQDTTIARKSQQNIRSNSECTPRQKNTSPLRQIVFKQPSKQDCIPHSSNSNLTSPKPKKSSSSSKKLNPSRRPSSYRSKSANSMIKSRIDTPIENDSSKSMLVHMKLKADAVKSYKQALIGIIINSEKGITSPSTRPSTSSEKETGEQMKRIIPSNTSPEISVRPWDEKRTTAFAIMHTFVSRLLKRSIFSRKRFQLYILFVSFLGFILLIYYMLWLFEESFEDQSSLFGFRAIELNENEIIYSLERKKHVLIERIRRYKSLSRVSSFLLKQFNSHVIVIIVTLCFFIAVIMYVKFKRTKQQRISTRRTTKDSNCTSKNNPIPRNESMFSTMQNEEIIMSMSGIDPNERFLEVFNQQKEYILRRKEEELAKQERLEEEKKRLEAELNALIKSNKLRSERRKESQIVTNSKLPANLSKKLSNEIGNSHLNRNSIAAHYRNMSSSQYQSDQLLGSGYFTTVNTDINSGEPVASVRRCSARIINRQNKSFDFKNVAQESDSYKFCNRLY